MGFRNQSDFCNETGYALPTVLILLSLLLVTTGIIMMMSLTQSRFIQKDIHSVKARYLAEAGLYTFLSDPHYFTDTTQSSFEVYLTDSVQVHLERQQYGAYWLLKSSAHSYTQDITLQVLVGARADSSYDNAVVMGDINSALIVTGNTTIRGDIISGSDGVQQRSFRGEPFTGSVEGDNIRTDSTRFPQFNRSALRRQIQQVSELNNTPPERATLINDTRFDLQRFAQTDSNCTFVAPGDLSISSRRNNRLPDNTTFLVNGTLEIDGEINLGEYARFFVRDSINIDGNISGHHSLFIAKGAIRLSGSPKLSTQLISAEQVTISDDSYLLYPSFVYVHSWVEDGAKQGTIALRANSIVDGVLLLPDVQQVITNDQSLITIDEHALLRGGIYNTSRTELNGTVEGTVQTHQFYFYQSPTNYLNWLRNSDVNVHQRPSPFTIPLGFSIRPNFMLLDYKEVAGDG